MDSTSHCSSDLDDVPGKIARPLNSTNNNKEDFQDHTISLDSAIVHHDPVAMKNNQEVGIFLLYIYADYIRLETYYYDSIFEEYLEIII